MVICFGILKVSKYDFSVYKYTDEMQSSVSNKRYATSEVNYVEADTAREIPVSLIIKYAKRKKRIGQALILD